MTSDCLPTQATLGELLRRWRRSRKLTQEAFGDLLQPHVRPSTVSCWETGLRHPSWPFLAQILSITGIPAHIAVGVQENDQPPGDDTHGD